MPNLSTVDPRVIYAMFKGEPGTRKSTQALSFPKPQYWFSWDMKMQGLLVPMHKWGIDPSKVDYDDYTDWSKAEKKLQSFRLNCHYDTLVFDSVTSCGDMTLNQTRVGKSGTTKNSGAAAGRNIAGISVNELEDYNAESSALNELIALTKDIQQYQKSQGHYVSIILIAHVMEVNYKDITGKMETSRTIVTAGKRVAAKIPAYCSEVYHFGKEKGGFVVGSEGDYMLSTESGGGEFARTSLNLDKEIKFGDKPLYDTWIVPAVKKLQEKPNILVRL